MMIRVLHEIVLYWLDVKRQIYDSKRLPILGWSGTRPRIPWIRKSPTFLALICKFSLRIVLITAEPIAAATLSQTKRSASPKCDAIFCFVTTIAIGWPFPRGLPKGEFILWKVPTSDNYLYRNIILRRNLPIVMISGITSWVWNDHQASPHRPKPLCASSAITTPPWERISLYNNKKIYVVRIRIFLVFPDVLPVNRLSPFGRWNYHTSGIHNRFTNVTTQLKNSNYVIFAMRIHKWMNEFLGIPISLTLFPDLTASAMTLVASWQYLLIASGSSSLYFPR